MSLPSSSRIGRRRTIALVFGAAVLLVAAATVVAVAGPVAEPADRTLVVTADDGGDRLLSVPVDDGTEVTLAYTHSVEKTPVRDVYVADGTELRMVRMVFDSYGAGLPSRADVERTEDGLVTQLNRSYESLRVATGFVADHELRVGDETYDLAAAADGGSVTLTVEDRSRVDALRDLVG